jgi:MYXO-CTERM domain-containing protein
MARIVAWLTVCAAGAVGCASPNEPISLASRTALLSGERTRAKLSSPQPAESGRYGLSVALLGDTLLVGEPGAELAGERGAGCVWQYGPKPDWQLTGTLAAATPGAAQAFGSKVALTEDQIFVAEPGDGFDVNGSLHVFDRDSAQEVQVLSFEEPSFGRDFAVAGSQLLVAGAGTPRMFERKGDAWSFRQRLEPSDPEARYDYGSAVGLSATVAAVATDEAEVVLFEKQGATWAETERVPGGDALALDETQLFIGDTWGGAVRTGVVHVFGRATGWQEVTLLTSQVATEGFGKSLVVTPERLVVAGDSAVQVFAREGNDFDELERLFPPMDDLGDEGLSSLAVADDELVVGAPQATAANLDWAGATFVFASCSSDADCGTARHCSELGRCEAVLPVAATCQRDSECATEHCVDGVCCNAACDDSCEACAEPDSLGRCVPVSGTPRAGRAACVAHEVCGGSCTGLSRSCSYAARLTVCGGRCTDSGAISSSCDGAGACEEEAEQGCGEYACVDGGCLAACADEADCRDGASCVSGSCVMLQVTACTPEGEASVGPLGARSCGAYVCDTASGACLSACSSSSQCSPGNVCDEATRNCVSEDAPRGEAGCSCSVAAPGPGHGVFAAVLVGLVLGLRRRWLGRLSVFLLLGASACAGDPPSPAGLGKATSPLPLDSVWVKQGRLSGGSEFGNALAASGSTLLVGGSRTLDWLELTNGNWLRRQRLEQVVQADEGCSALSVELDGDTALVSSQNGARVFTRGDDGSFVEQPRLGASGPDTTPITGCWLKIAGSHVAVSDDAKTLLFEREPAGFERMATVDGKVLALTADRVITGYQQLDGVDVDVMVYGLSGAQPELLTTLPQARTLDDFGPVVVADEASLIIAGSGVAQLYDAKRLHLQPVSLRPPDDGQHASFGWSLALAGDLLLVGEPGAEAAHAFRGAARAWQPSFSVQGPRDASGRWGNFGTSVAIRDDELLVGAPDFALTTDGPWGAVFIFGRCSEEHACSDGYYCAADAFCAPAKALGVACDKALDCLGDDCPVCESGYCVDGVCCESRCGGQCQACGEPESPGACVLVSGEPRAPREACAGSDETCRGRCSGDEPACVYSGTSESCGSSCRDGRETPATCSGHGECVQRGARTCLGYACGEAACLISCEANRDCTAGFSCVDHECVATARAHRCSEDGTRSITDEAEIPCGFYQCDVTSGDCRGDCTATSDCAAGLVCDVPRKACVRASLDPTPDAGCGCGLAEGGPRLPGWPGACLAVLCWLRRRWRAFDVVRS